MMIRVFTIRSAPLVSGQVTCQRMRGHRRSSCISRATTTPETNVSVRIEHWVVAEQQGQIAAINMLGGRQRYQQAPFFWSQHYDVPINYVGHAGKWETTEVVGDLKARDALVKYRRGGH